MAPDPANSDPPLTLELLWKDYAPFMRGVLRRRGVRGADVADVLQEVMRVADRLLPDFVPRPNLSRDAALRVWLYAICFRKASEHHDRAGSPPASALVPLDVVGEVPSDAPPPDVLHAVREDVAEVLELLDTLAPERRAIVVAYALEERPMRAIAEAQSISEHTAWTRLSLARRDLRVARKRLRAKERSFVVAAWLALLDRTCDAPPASQLADWEIEAREPAPAQRRDRATVLVVLAAAFITASLVSLGVARKTLNPTHAGEWTLTHGGVRTISPLPPLSAVTPSAVTATLAAVPVTSKVPVTARAPAAVPQNRAAHSSPARREERAFLAKAHEAITAGRLDDARRALAAHRRKFPNSFLADVRDRLEARARRREPVSPEAKDLD